MSTQRFADFFFLLNDVIVNARERDFMSLTRAKMQTRSHARARARACQIHTLPNDVQSMIFSELLRDQPIEEVFSAIPLVWKRWEAALACIAASCAT